MSENGGLDPQMAIRKTYDKPRMNFSRSRLLEGWYSPWDWWEFLEPKMASWSWSIKTIEGMVKHGTENMFVLHVFYSIWMRTHCKHTFFPGYGNIQSVKRMLVDVFGVAMENECLWSITAPGFTQKQTQGRWNTARGMGLAISMIW